MSEPDSIVTLLLILLAIVLVLLNGFFVATEFALVKVRSTRIKELADGGNTAAKCALDLLTHLDAYLSASQLGITLTSLGLGWVGEPAIAHGIVEPLFAKAGFDPADGVITTTSYALAFTIITCVHIVIGEQAPKWMAIQRAERVTLFVARAMRAFYWVFKPFITVLNAMSNAVVRAMGIKVEDMHSLAHSEEELRMIISASDTEHGGTPRETQAELLENVFTFGHRMARQIMRHRTEIAVLDVMDPLEINVGLAQQAGHTRFPVIQEDIDSAIGFIHTKDLYALYQRDPQGDLRSILRDILVVPESMRIDLLLRQMQRRRQQMAILVDEYGGTSGLVTIADLLEELVGALPDEFEAVEEEWVVPVSETTWTLDGRLSLADLHEHIGHELACEESSDTVGGYAFWAFGRIPEAGDVVEKNRVRLRVLAMDGHRVSRVELTLIPEVEEGMLEIEVAGARAR